MSKGVAKGGRLTENVSKNHFQIITAKGQFKNVCAMLFAAEWQISNQEAIEMPLRERLS